MNQLDWLFIMMIVILIILVLVKCELRELKMLLKDDREIINNTLRQEEALRIIADILDNADNAKERESYLREVLLEGMKSDKLHNPSHTSCTGFKKPQKGNMKEKRICKCMFYYLKDPNVCRICEIGNKWHNTGDINVTECEWPTKYDYSDVGGMDLILDDMYAVEIKPPKSRENIARMFAEILTYTLEPDINNKRYKPAIALFKMDSNKQMRQFSLFLKENNQDLKRILNTIDVFFICTLSLDAKVIDFHFEKYDGKNVI